MSTKKVEKYKEEKKNRTVFIQKKKRQQRIQVIISVLVCAVFIGWFGWSVYDKKTASAKPALNSENVQVVDEKGRQYEVKMNEDGTASLVLSDSGTSSVAESFAEAVLTESSNAIYVESAAEESADAN